MRKVHDKIEAKNWGIGSVIKQHRQLVVPPNQREYSWGDSEVQSLIQDFQSAIDRDDPYFLGAIVVTDSGDGPPQVIDGQQRLATVVIIMAAIRDFYLRQNDEKSAKSIEHDFLSEYIRGMGEDVAKVQLNVEDREYFRKRILARPCHDSDEPPAPTKHSHRRIARAAELAREFVDNVTTGQKPSVALARVNDIADFIEFSAQVVVLTALNAFSAFVVFEAMNDRGLRMSQIDILKNYLFNLSGSRLDEAIVKWTRTMNVLESREDPDIPLIFVRYMLIMETGPTKEKQIMEKVRGCVGTKQKAIEFLDRFVDCAPDFIATLSPDDPKWNDYPNSVRRHLRTVLEDLKVEQIMPLIFAVASRFSPKEAQKAFRLFVNWSVRFLVAGGRGGLLDTHYSETAHSVGTGQIKSAVQLADALRDILPPDGTFREKFATATVSRTFLARYYLRALELQAKGDKEPELIPNADAEVVNVEHVLPQSRSDDWIIEDEVAVGLYRRLGNMVLLQAGPNSQIGNDGFAKKKSVLKESAFFLTSMVAKKRFWGADEIDWRQKLLADLAVKTWPLK